MKKLTTEQAWDDLYAYIQAQDRWATLPKAERQIFYTAEADRRGTRKDRKGEPRRLGIQRLRALAEKYAPGRYQFKIEESVYLNENKPPEND